MKEGVLEVNVGARVVNVIGARTGSYGPSSVFPLPCEEVAHDVS